MAADRGLDASGGCAPAHHSPGVGLIHRLIGQRGSFPALGRAEQPAFAIVAKGDSLKDLGKWFHGGFSLTFTSARQR